MNAVLIDTKTLSSEYRCALVTIAERDPISGPIATEIVPVNSPESFCLAREVGRWVDAHPFSIEVYSSTRFNRTPEEKLALLRKRRANVEASRPKNTYTLLSPDGEEVTTNNLAGFARDHGLKPLGLWEVAKGKRYDYKGWRVLDIKRPG